MDWTETYDRDTEVSAGTILLRHRPNVVRYSWLPEHCTNAHELLVQVSGRSGLPTNKEAGEVVRTGIAKDDFDV